MKKTIGDANKARAKSHAAKRPAAKKAKSATPRASKNILAAGIKALSNVHEEALARQSRVFESILGLGAKHGPTQDNDAKAPNPLTAALDPFGFRKFEDVFDQRVARSLANLGVPTLQAVTDLAAEVERLRARIAVLETQGKKR